MASNTAGRSDAIKKLEYWTHQQQESHKAAAAADKERSDLQNRLLQLKARTAKIRQATSHAENTRGKHNDTVRHLEAKKKQLEQELDKERSQLEVCAESTKTLNEASATFHKKTAKSYKELNTELAQVIREQDIELVTSYITKETLGGTTTILKDCSEWDEMKAKFTEHETLAATRAALEEKVDALRAKALKASSTDPVRSWLSLFLVNVVD